MAMRFYRPDAPLVRVASAYKFCIFTALLVLLGACANAPAPTERVAAARAMVTQAQPLAAQDAPLELNIARTKLAAAEDLMQRGDNAPARRLAEEAEVDAKLALTVAENARAQRAAAEVEQGVQALREALERRKP